MTALNTIETSLEDLLECGYENLIDACEPTTLNYYYQLSKASQEETEKGNISKANALYLLAEACSLMLNATDYKKPFKPYYNYQGRRSTIPDDFSIEQGELLASFAFTVKNSTFAARLADLSWYISRSRKIIGAVKYAINNYIDASDNSYCKEHWPEKIAYLERALRLSIIFNDENKDLIVEKLIDCIDINSNNYDPRTSVNVCQLLANTKTIDDIVLAEKALLLANGVDNVLVYETKCSLLGIAAKSFYKVGNYTKVEECKLKIYEVLLVRAQQAEQANQMILAGHYYQKVIKALQDCKDQKEKIQEIQLILIKVNKDSLKEMKRISFQPNVDTTAFVKSIFERVKNIIHEDKVTTLIYFARFADTTLNKNYLEEVAFESYKTAPIRSTISKTSINADGRVVTKENPLWSSDDKVDSEAIKAACYQHAEILYRFSAHQILIIRDEITKFHNINEQSIYELIQYSLFLPSDRLNLWIKGILAGFNNEFDIALSLLIPQFEHALRKILEAKGVVIVFSNPDSCVHSEMTLNQLIVMKETQDFLGEDLQFELQGLLTERLGFNYRNEFAHGLMSESEFYTPAAIYLWWLLLHIVIRCNQIVQEKPQGEK